MGLALPPLGVLPGLLGLALLAWLLGEAKGWRQGFGWAFSFLYGYFLVGLYWVGIAFFADAERFGALAVPGVLALCAILAALQALPLTLVALRRWRSPLAGALAFGVLWILGESLRGWVTQFPWNPLSLVWAFNDAALQPVAWIGGRGLGLLTAVSLALFGLSWAGARRRVAVLALLPLPLVVVAGALRLTGPDPGSFDLGLRVVQANVAQHHKWDPVKRRAWLSRHMDLAAGEAQRPLRLVIWPESSIPYRLDPDPDGRRFITQVVPEEGYLIAGSDHLDRSQEPRVLHNSVYVMEPGGAIEARYDKVNLVPFGEFLPFRAVLGGLGLEALAVSSIDFSPGPGRRTLALGDVPPFSPLVCYEAVFEGAATDGTGRARWLLNVTNDAWFGQSSGPYQHLAMARTRAVETGLPLIRAANTGISVVTDAYGRVLARLDLYATGVIDAPLPRPLAQAPLIARLPWLSWLLVLLAGGAAGLLEGRCSRARV